MRHSAFCLSPRKPLFPLAAGDLGSAGSHHAPLPLLQYPDESIGARSFTAFWIRTGTEPTATKGGKGLSASFRPFAPKDYTNRIWKQRSVPIRFMVKSLSCQFKLSHWALSAKSSIRTLPGTWQLQFQPHFISPVKACSRVCTPIPGHLYSQACCSVSSTSDYLVNAINQNPIAENACISPTHLLPWQQFRLLFICQATSVEINSIVFPLTVLSVLDLIHGKI